MRGRSSPWTTGSSPVVTKELGGDGTVLSPRERMRPVIFRVVGALRPTGAAAPFEMPRAHVGPVADAEKQRAMGPVGVFVHLAGRMHDKGAGLDLDRLARRAHHAAALEAEIDFGRVGVAVIGADLAGLPAGDGDVALLDVPEEFLDVLLGIILGLFGKTEHLHCSLPDLC